MKIIIFGIGNEKEFNHYTVEKTKEAHRVLGTLFKRIFSIDWPMVQENHDTGEVKHINIEDYFDFHEIIGSWKNIGNDRIDIFYGNKKMFIVIHCSLEKRKEFHEKLEKVSEIIEPKEVKEKIIIENKEK